MTKKSDRWVVVTTDSTKRGVFCGKLVASEADRVVLEQARMAVYWSAETRGVLGLASIGPQQGSRIGPAVPRIELSGVSSIIDVTELALKRWEEEPWS